MSVHPEAGQMMLEEIREQPGRLHDAFESASGHSRPLAAAIRGSECVILLGRGSSRSAATYGAHALRVFARRPALVASPAELAWGSWRMPLERATVLAVSQSGQSREMLAAAERARNWGARLVVITNSPESQLAQLAESPADTLLCCAGPERAVPATKSFTTSVACLLAVACASQRRLLENARDELPSLVAALLDDDAPELTLGELDSFVLCGEGFGEAVAEEGAIKLRETLRVPVASFETSEFLHGSINSSRPGMGVITVATDDLSQGLAVDVVRQTAERGATTVHIGSEPIEGAERWLRLPAAPPEWAAILAIIPIQLAARTSALARGLDPDKPEGLNKVTLIDYRSAE
jgi:glutamine---fructose-6-phosphate transaminase (isomerizing)